MKAAIIGFGQVAEKAHLPGFAKKDIEVVAVAEGLQERREAAKALLPNVRIYETMDALLDAEKDLDFVDICTPPYLHAQQVSAALKRGRSVLCEKPLAVTAEEMEQVKQAAIASGKVCFTVHNWAYAPQWLKAYEICASGKIGEIKHVELHAMRTQPASGANADDWRRKQEQAGGGVLVDHGWHNVYLLRRLVNARPDRVMTRLRPEDGIDEEATVFMEFPNSSGMIYLTWGAGVRRNTALISGTKGVLELEDDEIVLTTASGTEHLKFDAALSAASAHPDWFTAMLPDFLGELSDESKKGKNLEEAAFVLGIIHRCYASVRQGRNPLRQALRPQERSRR